MKIMLVDDEKLALLQLERMLTNAFSERGLLERITEIHSFQRVSEALAHAQLNPPDLVFLDIHMPEMTGLKAAEHIQQIVPDVDIIFVTAFDEFAVKAFELNALDYLLKPVAAARLQKTMDRVLASYAASEAQTENEKPIAFKQKIYCLNHIRFQSSDGTIFVPKWRTAKAQELFAFLLHHRGAIVPKHVILNMFVPELDKKRAMTQLYTVIYQIRKCMKEANFKLIIETDSIQEGYRLLLEDTVVDIEEWEASLISLATDDANNYEQLEQLLHQFDGDYMGNYEYMWAENERERLRRLWMDHAKRLMQHQYAAKEWESLTRLGDRLVGMNPYEFDCSVLIMEAYDHLGQYDKLKHFYYKQEKHIREELDLPLPDNMISWFQTWLKNRKGLPQV